MAPFATLLGGSISLPIKFADAHLEGVPHNLRTAKGNRIGVPRAISVDRNGERTFEGSFFIEGASKDDAIAQLKAINALLREGTTLAMQTTDATYAVTLVLLPSRAALPSLQSIAWENDHQGWVPFVFTCEPYAYGPETTIIDEVAVTAPCVVDITVPGDFKAPLQVEFTPTGDALHCAYLGLLPDQTTEADELIRGAASFHGSGTIEVSATGIVTTSAAHGLVTGQSVVIYNCVTTPATTGTYHIITVIDATHFSIGVNITVVTSAALDWGNGSSFSTAPTFPANADCLTGEQMSYNNAVSCNVWHPDQMLPRGTYQLLARIMSTAYSPGYYAIYGMTPIGALGMTDVTLPYPSVGYSLEPFRSFQLPSRRTLASALSYWTFGMAGNCAALLDYIAAMPTSWGWAFYHPETAAETTDALLVDYDGRVYADGIAAGASGSCGGLTAVGSQSLVVAMGQQHAAANTYDVPGTLTIKVVPRYALWADDGAGLPGPSM